ncbi:MAG: PFL family protein [Candidatus Omnitrophica bacterium]|nr:PFL family protein [Candidatus Omnitrophota bacterium]
MALTVEEVFETARMIIHQNLDIRTATLSLNLRDCVHSDFQIFLRRVKNKIITVGRKLVQQAEVIEQKYGIPIVNKRIAVTPVTLLLNSNASKKDFLKFAKTLDYASQLAGIDFIGGFGGFCQKRITKSISTLLDCLPEVLAQTNRVCSFLNVGTTTSGLNIDVINLLGPMLKATAAKSRNGVGCAKFVVFVNAPEDNPFMAGAFCGPGEPDAALNIGISGPGVVRSVIEKNKDCDLIELSDIIKRTVFKITRAGELIGKEIATQLGVPFGIVDISLASTTKAGDSVAKALEAMGIESFGAPGSTLAVALLMDAVKKGGAMASSCVGGLSGTFLPVSEDSAMVEAVKRGSLSLEKLEALSAVCSVGLDMVAIPGSTDANTISAIIADELAIGIINNKTTAVRILPIPRKKVGSIVHLGGLLGTAIVMPVKKWSAKNFLKRGGRLPAPLIGLRN